MADFAAPGPFAVVTDEGEWHDAARGRTLRWRHYQPQALAGGDPVPAARIIHSHGLGGTRASGERWLTHWASWGIAATAVQHPGSDGEARTSDSPLALRHLLRTAVDANQLADRQRDLLFAVNCAAKNGAVPIGLSGHSFGAASVLRVIGERRGRDDIPADPRVTAAILFSPSARGGLLPLGERFAGVALPCLHLTGSLDSGIGPGDISARERWLPYLHSASAQKWLLSQEGATHPELAGDAGTLANAARAAALRAATTAFWHAFLGQDAAAATWLRAHLPQPEAHPENTAMRR